MSLPPTTSPEMKPHRPPPQTVYAVAAKRVAAHFDALPVEARRILRLFDGTRPVTAVCAASGLPDAVAARVVDRLLAMGLLQPFHPRRRRETPEALQRWCRSEPLPEPVAPRKGVLARAFAASAPSFIEPPEPIAPGATKSEATPRAAAIDAPPAASLVELPALRAPSAAALTAAFSDEEEAFFARPSEEPAIEVERWDDLSAV